MKKYLFLLIAAMAGALNSVAAITADWKTHMPFDIWATQVVETPSRVYFLSRTFEYSVYLSERGMPSHSLFYYDKAGDETVSVNERANSNGNAVACIGYNAAKKYLLVVYTDCNIDFLYDDGRVFNLPALKITAIPGKKQANSITFDNASGRAYVATSFGYLALNDEKHEVAESRNYSRDVKSIARCGSNMVLAVDDAIYFAPASGHRFNFDDYKPVSGSRTADMLVALDGDNFMAYKNGAGTYIDRYVPDGDNFNRSLYSEDPYLYSIQQIAGGNAYRLTGNSSLYEIKKDGTVDKFTRPESEYTRPAASLDGTSLWTLTDRKGLRGFRKAGESWTLAHDYMRPNAPAAYLATSFAYSPGFGMLAGSNGIDLAYNETGQSTPVNVSALKGGIWKEFGPDYTASSISGATNFGGLSIDPRNPNHVYRNNTIGGLMRIDLSNPENVLILANPSSRFKNDKGFIRVVDDQSVWNVLCRFSEPSFSPDGTMWTLYNNRDQQREEIWYWPVADRLATTSAASYRPMGKIPVPEMRNSNYDFLIALSRNKNMVAIGGYADSGTVMIYDHNGTPDYTGDDRYSFVTSPYDQDGGGVNFLVVNNLFEDPSTGLVWILSQRGVFTLNPATIFEEPNRVNRIKVARNDGTNLADYLLNEINVNSMSIDGEGRKWFSTSSGLVCTSADGRTILGEFTTDNSYLPGNNVYATGYNPDNNSIMVGTEGGIVEMFPSGSGGGSSSETNTVRAYPNPVEPDFYGWVRIDNVADGSLVKITDAGGGVVKELGPAQGGSVEWDISGLNNTRVATGVYYIMVSPGSGSDGSSQISKILVLN